MHVELYAEALALTHSVVHKVVPLFGGVVDRSLVHDADVESLDTAYPGSSHGFEIRGNTLL